MDSNITLWQFLLDLLVSNKHKDIIQWTNNDGEFKLIHPEDVANLWGRRKNKLNMNYDKLSRALRYYYDKKIIKKVMGQKFMYKFVSFPEIVKKEIKVPFRQMMETLAQEYGQQVFPHLASYNAASIKSSAENAMLDNAIKKGKDSVSSDRLEFTQYSEISLNQEMSDIHVPARSQNGHANLMTSSAPMSSVVFVSSNSVAMSTQCALSRPDYSNSSSKPKPNQLMLNENPPVQTTITTATPVPLHSPKPKPNPLMLNVNSQVQTTLSAGTPVPLLSPKQFAHFSTLHTPFMMASPMIGLPRTPIPLHFWSSLSPIATLSPRLAASTSAFQFPIVSGQLPLPNFSAIEGLSTPAVSSPIHKIPVI